MVWILLQVKEMREFLEPVLMKVLHAVTPETVSDWSMCMSEISVRETDALILIVFVYLEVLHLEFENLQIFIFCRPIAILVGSTGFLNSL